MQNNKMAQIEAMKTQTFGVEIEMNNITRENAAMTCAALFGTFKYWDTHSGHPYFMWKATDAENRVWTFSRDCSISGIESEKCEMITPILTYKDIPLLQEVVKELRKHGAKSCPSRGCGVHIHIGGDGQTPKSIRALCNIMAQSEQTLIKSVNVATDRIDNYCGTVDRRFLNELNRKKPDTMRELEDIWYTSLGCDWGRTQHYNGSRYHMLNLHSFFHGHGTIEFRLFQFDEAGQFTNKDGTPRQGGLHAGQLKAMIQLCLALCQMAKQAKSCKTTAKSEARTAAYMHNWFWRIGFVGEEFETARNYFTRNLEVGHYGSAREANASSCTAAVVMQGTNVPASTFSEIEGMFQTL